MIVVFDTNIWQSTLYKGSGASAAVRFYLRRSGATVAIPEVVRLEVEHNLRQELDQWIKSIEDSYRQLLAVFGTLKEIVLPTAAAIDAAIKDVATSLGVQTLDVPFSAESAHAAFLKVIRKEPPCHHTQQFKDAVLWHDCLQLAQKDDVTLVSNDKAFYRDLKYDKGLAENLLQEAATRRHQIKVFNQLTDLLKLIRVDQIGIADDAVEYLKNKLLEMSEIILKTNGFVCNDLVAANKELYATEKTNVLFVEATFHFPCVDVREEGRTSAILRLGGATLYDIESKQTQKVQSPHASLSYVRADGVSEERQIIYASANIVLGHKDVHRAIRYKLEE